MKIAYSLMISSVLIGGAAFAQTNEMPQSTTAQPAQSTAPSQGSSSYQNSDNSGSSKMSMSQKRMAMKECVAQLQQGNSSMSKADAKKQCKTQLKNQG
jgi:hypothetical protein